MGFADTSIPQESPLPYHPSPPIAPETGLGGDGPPHAMLAIILAAKPRSDAEALMALRAAFPDSPLSLRIAALGMLMRRGRSRGSH
jgi:hypothetical protein